jgi:carbon-monoxide dehydrogenase small subunit
MVPRPRSTRTYPPRDIGQLKKQVENVMRNSRVSINLNGKVQDMLVQPGTTLLLALRENLGQTATRRGCEQGTCGSCTVLVDGRPVMSCLVPVEMIEGARVETLEGLTPAHGLHPLQEAFLEGFATQCGYCTSGMIMAATGLLAENLNPSRNDVIRAISGNVCRCTGYESIIDAILDGAKRLAKSRRQAA